ncbi:ABC transporter ATP-binding protein [Methylobacterium sp. WCS2018Hpa-22]|uniref:ABC transporter ATP-binding protein n=1 Tax=Methylobacterium sp. WCS2018Hpa-22 TaxID=3073633 RepID=UPI00288A4371|nr:ABC transporter ATP-binding protein [Methylobacterium sp. WCS2018Hpa-22]
MNVAVRPHLVDRPRSVSLPASRQRLHPRIVEEDAPFLVVEGVSLGFGGTVALDAVDLSVGEGEIHAVIGPNGAGKSSLINAISGLYAPDSGAIRIGDDRFSRVPTRHLARLGVARTFQNLALFRGLTVLDTVTIGLVDRQSAGLGAQVLGLPHARREAREHRERAEAVIAALDLADIRDRLVGTLPYGVQKRVELARALVAKPRLLLLDEPMAGMTATEKQRMSGDIRAARDSTGTTIVLIEHDVGVVMSLSDRVTVLDHGRRIASGTPTEVQADPAVIAAYLGLAFEAGA